MIDNNGTARLLRGVAVARRNRTFSVATPEASTAAVILTFVASFQVADLEVYAWFEEVQSRDCAQGHPVNRLTELLPHWKPLAA